MKRILLIGLSVAALPILGVLIWIGTNPAGFVHCLNSFTHTKAMAAQAQTIEPKAAKTPEEIKWSAEDFGHRVALYVLDGHSLPADTYAMCALEAEKQGLSYKDDQYERFINIAQRQVTKELHKDFER